MPPKSDVMQGTLDLLILRTVMLAPLHGWGISRRIRDLSDEVFQVGQGSLYPALYRLEAAGLLRSAIGETEEGRPAKLYHITPKGRAQFDVERRSWRVYAAAVENILAAT